MTDDDVFNPTLTATLRAMREEWTAPIVAERDNLRGILNMVVIDAAQGQRNHAANAEAAGWQIPCPTCASPMLGARA